MDLLRTIGCDAIPVSPPFLRPVSAIIQVHTAASRGVSVGCVLHLLAVRCTVCVVSSVCCAVVGLGWAVVVALPCGMIGGVGAPPSRSIASRPARLSKISDLPLLLRSTASGTTAISFCSYTTNLPTQPIGFGTYYSP